MTSRTSRLAKSLFATLLSCDARHLQSYFEQFFVRGVLLTHLTETFSEYTAGDTQQKNNYVHHIMLLHARFSWHRLTPVRDAG